MTRLPVRSARPKCLLPVMLLVSLTSCAGAPSSNPQQACSAIPLTAYSRDVQKRMADELPAAGADVQNAMADYGALRAAVRACQSVK